MQDQIDGFLAQLAAKAEASENTIAAYRNDLNQLAAFLAAYRSPFGDKISNWRQVDSSVLQAYMLEMKDRDYAATTVARKVAAMKSFFEYLLRTGVIETDPTEALASPKVKKQAPRTIPPEQVDRLLAAPAIQHSANALRDVALMETLYATGVRVSELINLDLADVDLFNRLVACNSGRRSRVVPIFPRAVAALQAYLDEGRPQLVVDANEQALFLNHRGQRLTRQGLWLIIKRYVNEIGIDDGEILAMRHGVQQLLTHAHQRGGSPRREIEPPQQFLPSRFRSLMHLGRGRIAGNAGVSCDRDRCR